MYQILHMATLKNTEWALAGSLTLILLSLWVVAKILAWHFSQGTSRECLSHVTIEVEGEVEHPGLYTVAKGTPVGEILRKARPNRYANLRTIDVEAPIVAEARFNIESLQRLTIHVTGAVTEPMEIEVLPGTRICQLRQRVSLNEDADLSFFKKKRLLADGEILVIPKKNS
jgi:hypothetical protein